MKKRILAIALLALVVSLAFASEIKAYDFTAYDRFGQEHKLSEYYGKPIVMNFWASWCGPCKSELPSFMKAAKAYEDVVFLFINATDGSRETVDKATTFLAKQGYTMGTWLFDKDFDGIATYGITSYPTTFFINKAGILVAGAQGTINYSTLEQGLAMIR